VSTIATCCPEAAFGAAPEGLLQEWRNYAGLEVSFGGGSCRYCAQAPHEVNAKFRKNSFSIRSSSKVGWMRTLTLACWLNEELRQRDFLPDIVQVRERSDPRHRCRQVGFPTSSTINGNMAGMVRLLKLRFGHFFLDGR